MEVLLILNIVLLLIVVSFCLFAIGSIRSSRQIEEEPEEWVEEDCPHGQPWDDCPVCRH